MTWRYRVSLILVFNLSFILESGLVKYSAGDYVSIFRSFRPNPPNNEQVTLWTERNARRSSIVQVQELIIKTKLCPYTKI